MYDYSKVESNEYYQKQRIDLTKKLIDNYQPNIDFGYLHIQKSGESDFLVSITDQNKKYRKAIDNASKLESIALNICGHFSNFLNENKMLPIDRSLITDIKVSFFMQSGVRTPALSVEVKRSPKAYSTILGLNIAYSLWVISL